MPLKLAKDLQKMRRKRGAKCGFQDPFGHGAGQQACLLFLIEIIAFDYS